MGKWIVSKFGGSSVKNAEAILRCSKIIENNPDIKVVVISATQNTTNQLEWVAQSAQTGDRARLEEVTHDLIKKHKDIALELFTSPDVLNLLDELFNELKNLGEKIFTEKECNAQTMDHLYSIGERMSSLLVSDLLRLRMPENDIHFIDARKIIKTSSDFKKAEPQIDLIAKNTKAEILPILENSKSIIVTQGFIGSDLLGNTTTLGREGSDYSAALFGEAIGANLVQIWTDVPGVASTDPRVVSNVKYIPHLSYDEATAMATLGAKVLFPTTLLPAKRKNIPVFVGSSLEPAKQGTIVDHNQDLVFSLKGVSLLKKESDLILSFIGTQLDQKVDLVKIVEDALKSKYSATFFDLTSCSISYKMTSNYSENEVLQFGHEILLKYFN